MLDPPTPRSRSPESTMTSSLIDATATIDELTAALQDASRSSSPQTPFLDLSCCCGTDDCEATEAWLTVKRKLEKRLVLSAEVGQALLQRHEAFVRRQDAITKQAEDATRLHAEAEERITALTHANDQLVAKMADLAREHSQMEKRLTQSLLNLDVADSSNRTLLHEIHEARSALSRLTTQHARTVGWEAQLAAVTQERDDLREERKSEATRARVAELKAAVLAEKYAKLQAELNSTREEMESQRLSRADLSSEILQSARERLRMMQGSLGQPTIEADSEVTHILESLAGDNEALKRDNAELQNLLAEAREEVKALQEEVDEQRASQTFREPLGQESLFSTTGLQSPTDTTRIAPISPILGAWPTSRKGTAWTKGHRAHESWASFSPSAVPHSPRNNDAFSRPVPQSPLYNLSHPPRKSPRSMSVDLDRSSDSRPLSPSDSIVPSEVKWSSISQPKPRYPSSSLSAEVEPEADTFSSPPRAKRKQLMLLSRSRGVQTDPVAGGLFPIPSPSPRPSLTSGSSTPPPEGRSDTSSILDPKTPAVPVLIERVTRFYTRMVQADVRTLNNRLKRQHLSGADVGHVSRTTISGIVAEVVAMRAHFRAVLDDEKTTNQVTRKDFKGLLKLFTDLFNELAELRIRLNEVTLDPSLAEKLRQEAMGSEADAMKGRTTAARAAALGWIAPLSKLFSTPTIDVSEADVAPLTRNKSERGRPRTSLRAAPKLAPAISASTTTVNVEFGSNGIRRAVSTLLDPSSEQSRGGTTSESESTSEGATAPHVAPASLKPQTKEQLLGIFAGAPRSAPKDGWVMVSSNNSKGSRSVKPTASSANLRNFNDATIRGDPRRVSRIVEAVVEATPAAEDTMAPETLLERQLRPRGLSDSSIHSTFVAAGTAPPTHRLVTPASLALTAPTLETGTTPPTTGPLPDRQSVLQALSKKVQSFRIGTTSASTTVTKDETSPPERTTPEIRTSPPRPIPRPKAPRDKEFSPSRRSEESPGRSGSMMGYLSSWAVGHESFGDEAMVGSIITREESSLHRAFIRGREF